MIFSEADDITFTVDDNQSDSVSFYVSFGYQHKMTTKQIGDITAKLIKHNAAIPFISPVIPILHGCPEYLEKIKSPMSLSELLPSDTLTEVTAKVVLTLSNCYEYNPKDHFLRVQAKTLALYFEKLMQKFGKVHWPSHMDDLRGKRRLNLQLLPLYPVAISVQERPKTIYDFDYQEEKHRGKRSAPRPDYTIETQKKPRKEPKVKEPKVKKYISTMEKKIHIASALGESKLDQKQLTKVIEMIRHAAPQLVGEEELDLDIDLLGDVLVRKIFVYVAQIVPFIR